jgi:hypothetical protein
MSLKRKEVKFTEEEDKCYNIFSYPPEFIHNLRKYSTLKPAEKERVDEAWDRIYEEEKEFHINKTAEESGISYLESQRKINLENFRIDREFYIEQNSKRNKVRKSFYSSDTQQIIKKWIKEYCDEPMVDSDDDMPILDSDDDMPILDSDDDKPMVDSDNKPIFDIYNDVLFVNKQINKFARFYSYEW